VINRITALGVLVGFIGTRFMENRNLLVTNVFILISALAFRTSAKIVVWVIKRIKE
jgi:hypothetical protein